MVEEQKIQYYVRIANTDLQGKKALIYALSNIKGIGYPFANAICNILSLDKNQKMGLLGEKDIKKIEDTIKEKEKFPIWMLNRRKDIETGKNEHVITSSLKFTQEVDIKRKKKTRSYQGIRHANNLPVRGQRTRVHFRKGSAIGVQKKKIKKGAV